MHTPTPDDTEALLARATELRNSTERRYQAILEQEERRRREHEAHMAEMDAILAQTRATRARLDALHAQVTDPDAYTTTIAQARRMAERETHPSWFQAAYADLAQRMARLDTRVEELEASMSLRHTKMEMIIAHLVADEGQDRTD